MAQDGAKAGVGAATGAGTGAAAGSAFGPIGTGVGAAVGAIGGLLSNLDLDGSNQVRNEEIYRQMNQAYTSSPHWQEMQRNAAQSPAQSPYWNYLNSLAGSQTRDLNRERDAMRALEDRAFGRTSDMRNTYMDQQRRLGMGMMGQAASIRGTYNPSAYLAARYGASNVPMEFAASRYAAEKDERARALAAYQQAYGQRLAEDQAAFGQERQRQSDMRDTFLTDEGTRLGQAGLGLAQRRTDISGATQDQVAKAQAG